MSDLLTRPMLESLVGGSFQALNVAPAPVVLVLAEVAGGPSSPRQEAWSATFRGPAGLPQQIYRLAHRALGEFEIFLVPVGQDERGGIYEAVFNRLLG